MLDKIKINDIVLLKVELIDSHRTPSGDLLSQGKKIVAIQGVVNDILDSALKGKALKVDGAMYKFSEIIDAKVLLWAVKNID